MAKDAIGLLLAALTSRSLASETTSMPFMPMSILRVTQRRHRRRELPLAAVDDQKVGHDPTFFVRLLRFDRLGLGRLAARKRRDSTRTSTRSRRVALDLEGAVLALAGRRRGTPPSTATVAVPWMCEMSKTRCAAAAASGSALLQASPIAASASRVLSRRVTNDEAAFFWPGSRGRALPGCGVIT